MGCDTDTGADLQEAVAVFRSSDEEADAALRQVQGAGALEEGVRVPAPPLQGPPPGRSCLVREEEVLGIQDSASLAHFPSRH